MRFLHAAACLGAGLLLLAALPGRAAPPPVLEPLDHAVCRLIEEAARANRLPVDFVTRLIWRESSFRAGAVSRVGAQGIAQFMPQTAAERGLADPFDPEQAIPEAAALLADLRRRFGSLDVAAAAYNAGPGRVAAWLRGESDLPSETRAYVRFVGADTDEEAAQPPSADTCLAMIAILRRPRGNDAEIDGGFAPLAPWGVQLAGNFSKARALASFERARGRTAAAIGEERPMVIGRRLRSRGTRRFYQVRLPAATRAVAEALCGRIKSAGGVCVVLRS